MNIDFAPIKTFFSEDTHPREFAKLLDEFLYEHMILIAKLQSSDYKDKTIHPNTEQFIAQIKLLRDVLLFCEK
jgi:hypothetical protein